MLYFFKTEVAMVSKKEQIFRIIRANKQGWAFSATDFLRHFNRREIDESLSALVEEGSIRRIIRGIYDYPMYSKILNQKTAPDIHQIAKAIARKFNWTIFPDGDTALNYLGLSNQVVARYLYLSDGNSKKYSIAGNLLEFKHISSKEAIIQDEKAALVIQAVRAIGEKKITKDFITALAGKFTSAEWKRIADNSATAINWVYSVIKEAKNISEENQNG
jgi:hypothetical protein